MMYAIDRWTIQLRWQYCLQHSLAFAHATAALAGQSFPNINSNMKDTQEYPHHMQTCKVVELNAICLLTYADGGIGSAAQSLHR